MRTSTLDELPHIVHCHPLNNLHATLQQITVVTHCALEITLCSNTEVPVLIINLIQVLDQLMPHHIAASPGGTLRSECNSKALNLHVQMYTHYIMPKPSD